MRVSPFGHLRIIAHLQLPAAFRSLSRPSSAPGAKASALRPNSLDLLQASLDAWSFSHLCSVTVRVSFFAAAPAAKRIV